MWAERSIEQIGYERDFYVHYRNGVPISVESDINRGIETPISKSDTWLKIKNNKTDCLDRSDKPILYALIRHLEARTPHYAATLEELARLAANPDSDIKFSQEEREIYARMRADPDEAKRQINAMSSTLKWTERGFRGSALSIVRSPIPLRSSTTPVLAISAPDHPALWLPLPGMTPFQLVLTLNRTTAAMLVLGNFSDAFSNTEITLDVAKGINRRFVGQFSYFGHVRHLITHREELEIDMTWAPYNVVSTSDKKMTFHRRLA